MCSAAWQVTPRAPAEDFTHAIEYGNGSATVRAQISEEIPLREAALAAQVTGRADLWEPF